MGGNYGIIKNNRWPVVCKIARTGLTGNTIELLVFVNSFATPFCEEDL